MYESLAPDLNSTFTESQVLQVTMEQGECLRSKHSGSWVLSLLMHGNFSPC